MIALHFLRHGRLSGISSDTGQNQREVKTSTYVSGNSVRKCAHEGPYAQGDIQN